MKRRIFTTLLAICMCLALLPATVFAAEVFSKDDIAVINSIIEAQPGLGLTKAPADGSSKPGDWDNIVYWKGGTPKRVSSLNLWGENLTGSLNVSGLPALTYLDCRFNELTGLDLSGLPALTALNCSFNQLTGLDVSSLTALTDLDCRFNELTGTLDMSGMAALTRLDCSFNQLTGLVLNNGVNYQYIDVRANCMTDTSAVTGPTIPWGDVNLKYQFNPQHYTIANILTNITSDNPATFRLMTDESDYIAKLSADNGYMLPAEISVRVGETELTRNKDYTYDSGTGNLRIFANSIFNNLEQPNIILFKPNFAVCSGGGSGSISGDIEIEAAGVPIVYSVSVDVEPEGSGTASATPNAGPAGTTITLNAEPNSGWQFKEWQILSGAIGISDNMFMMPESNVMVKAVFEVTPVVVEEETVIFDPAGGKWEDGITDPKIIKAKVNDEITIIEAPAKEGFEFQYWQGSKYQPGDKYRVLKGGHTFTAVWLKTTATKPSDPTETTKPTGTTTPTETVKLTDSDQTLPKTGENIGIYLWPNILLFAAGGLLLVLRKKRISKIKG
ncbi:MAG TPA: hypothetical protein GXZ76_03155 [Clostridiaceae bacterium]|jgi:hypothetical protein|nr:hypothetical protein [Clostridiaceae bacterium]